MVQYRRACSFMLIEGKVFRAAVYKASNSDTIV